LSGILLYLMWNISQYLPDYVVLAIFMKIWSLLCCTHLLAQNTSFEKF
jgi:hypothetical protein